MAQKKTVRKEAKKTAKKKTPAVKTKSGGDALLRERSMYFDSMLKLRNHEINSMFLWNLVFVAFQIALLAVFAALLTTGVPVVLAAFAAILSYMWHRYYIRSLSDLAASRRKCEEVNAEIAGQLGIETKLFDGRAPKKEGEVSFGASGEPVEKVPEASGPYEALRLLPTMFCCLWVVFLAIAIVAASKPV